MSCNDYMIKLPINNKNTYLSDCLWNKYNKAIDSVNYITNIRTEIEHKGKK